MLSSPRSVDSIILVFFLLLSASYISSLTNLYLPSMMIIKCNHQPVKVRCRRHNNQNMEYLMRASPDIVFAWCSAFWPSRLFVVSSHPLSTHFCISHFGRHLQHTAPLQEYRAHPAQATESNQYAHASRGYHTSAFHEGREISR